MLGVPVKRQAKRESVKEQVTRLIASEGLRPGDRIAGQVALAKTLKTSQLTVHRALTELASEGVVERRRGEGTFVRQVRKTRKRVMDACLLMSHPNLDAPSANPAYWPYVRDMLGCFTQACGSNWTFTAAALSESSEVEDFARFDAVFVHYAPQISNAFVAKLIAANAAPVVRLSRLQDGDASWDCTAIDHDGAEGTRNGVSHLLQNGYRRIAMVLHRSWSEVHLDGYCQGLEGFGVRFDPELVLRVGAEQWEASRAVELLESTKVQYDAIVTDCDLRALDIVDALRQRGRQVPQDVAVMGYAGLDSAVAQPPYLSTVRAPWSELIAAALRHIEQAPGKPTPRQQMLMAGSVIRGATIGRRGI